MPTGKTIRKRTLVLRFDVTGWSDVQVEDLAREALVQGEQSDDHPESVGTYEVQETP